MTSTLRAMAVGAAAAALIVGTAAAPATAKTRTFKDKRDDAVAALDITKVKVANKKRAVVVTATIPGLKKKQVGGVMVMLRTKAKGRPEFGVMKMRIEGAGWMPLMFMAQESEDILVACKGDRVTFKKRAVKIRIPQRCLDDNRRAVRVQVVVAGREVIDDGQAPKAGSDALADGHPNLGMKFTPWVRYR